MISLDDKVYPVIIYHSAFFGIWPGFSNRIKQGEEYVKKQLIEALSDSSIHFVISPSNLVLSSRESAIKVAEPILFSVYGKRKIKKERPYNCYLIDNYWVISGTFPGRYRFGGTFLIILDAKNSSTIKVTHGK